MKKLHLIRHAKSSWEDSSLADIDRPLNSRGIRSCQAIAPEIIKAGCHFEHAYCSPAVRAQSTIEQISQHITQLDIQWQTDERLYTFSSRALMTWCHNLDNSISEVVIIGHNPAITDLCNDVGNQHIDNVPTCSYVQLAFGQNAWEDLSTNSAELLSFLTPKMFI